MLGLANENLVKEALNGLGAQILELANMEKEDMKSITNGFIELKGRIEKLESNPAIGELLAKIEILNKEFANFKLAVSYLDKEMKDLDKKKIFKETITSPIIEKIEMPKMEKSTEIILEKMQTGDTSTEGVPETMVGYCITCGKNMIIRNPKIEHNEDGGKMTTGPCIKCGRVLFKIH